MAVLGLPLWAVAGGGAAVAALGWNLWLAGQAREVVERWAERQRYRMLRCRRAWLAELLGSGTTRAVETPHVLGRAFAFEILVEDRRLGGMARGRAIARREPPGGFDEEPEVTWHELDIPGRPAAPF